MKALGYKMRSLTKRGFTLIEIMVATVIMIVLVGLVIQITSEVLKVWNRSSGKLSSNAEARIALDLLTQDLETAVFRNNKMQWLEAETKTIPSVGGFQPQTINLMLFTPALDRQMKDNSDADIPGDICAVQYELVYQDPVDGQQDVDDNVFALHRRIIDPSTTFNSLMGDGNQNTFDSWDAEVIAPVGVALNPYPAPNDPSNYLSGNIANFQIQFYVVDSAGNENLVTSPVRYGGTNATVGSGTAVTANLSYPISYAEIKLTVLSDEGMDILRVFADPLRSGTGYTNANDIVKEHGEVYTRRVNFMARPL